MASMRRGQSLSHVGHSCFQPVSSQLQSDRPQYAAEPISQYVGASRKIFKNLHLKMANRQRSGGNKDERAAM